MIRTLIVDDHPAVLRGLVSGLRFEPGMVAVATATDLTTALTEAKRSDPNVAVIDYQLAHGDGLSLCHALKALAAPPAVLIYSAFARRELAVAARVAGADGMVDKGASLDELLDAIRAVYRGENALPALRPEMLERAAQRLDPDDLPILGMRVEGTTLSEIASVLQVEEREVSRRLATMLGRLAPPGASGRGDR